jgi:hypothetical protein
MVTDDWASWATVTSAPRSPSEKAANREVPLRDALSSGETSSAGVNAQHQQCSADALVAEGISLPAPTECCCCAMVCCSAEWTSSSLHRSGTRKAMNDAALISVRLLETEAEGRLLLKCFTRSRVGVADYSAGSAAETCHATLGGELPAEISNVTISPRSDIVT